MSVPPMDDKSRGFKEHMLEYWSLHIMRQTLFVREKHIIVITINFLNRNFVLMCNLLMQE